MQMIITWGLPRSLEHFKLYGQLGSPTGLLTLCSGNLPQLKTLVVAIGRVHGHANWANFVQQMALPSLEQLNLSYCVDLTGNDVLCIAKAAPNIPKLRIFKVIMHEKTTAADPQLASEFFYSAICRNLEILELQGIKFDGDGFKSLENASNMPCLKTLFITATTKRDVQGMAEAGARGAWPQLQTLEICRSIHPLIDDEGNVVTEALNSFTSDYPKLCRDRKDFQEYCRDLFEPIWPALNLKIL